MRKMEEKNDFEDDLFGPSTASTSTFCHQLSLGAIGDRETQINVNGVQEFFQIDILTSDIYTPSQRKESGYDTNSMKQSVHANKINSPHVADEEILTKISMMVEETEENFNHIDIQDAAENFLRNPHENNFFYPNFDYIEQQAIKEENLPEFRQYIRQTLKSELERTARDKILNEAMSIHKVSSEIKELKKNHENSKKERCTSPDLFEGFDESDEVAMPKKAKFDSNPYSELNQSENCIGDDDENNEEESSERRQELISKIEDLMKNVLENLVDGNPVEFYIRNINKWENCNLVDDVLTLKSSGTCTERKISLTDCRTKSKFGILIHLLSEIYHLLVTGCTCTLRELYYRDPELVESQINVVAAIKDICCLLDAAPWELGILSSSKGLLAGQIRLTLANDHVIDCSNYPGGILMPQDTSGIKFLESTAKLVLVVEKDTVYERLLQQNILCIMGYDILLVTGKGFPDINTRVMLRKIWDHLKLPIYVLVDADPFGIEILLVYRYGSRAMSYNSDHLVCPHVRWIGIHPSEIELLAVPSIPLNVQDKKRLTDLLSRSYLKDDVKDELLVLQKINRKAEIEGVSSFSLNFLTVDYIPSKIKRNFIV